MELELITVNAQGRAKEITHLGRKYLVVPVRMIVPGVLNGSGGKLHYSADQIASNPSDWNGIPIVAPNHPTKNGKRVSARSPAILEKYGIGTVYNAIANYSLDAEGWFDVERTMTVDSRIISWIRSNKKIELSTGLGLKKKKAPAGAVDNKGRTYDYDTLDYKPDHLAVLTDTVGACSIADGCGVLANSSQDSLVELATNEGNIMPVKQNIWHQMGVALGFIKDESTQVVNQLSFSDIRSSLDAQLRERFPSKMDATTGRYLSSPCWVVDIYKDVLIYSKDSEYYRLPYSTKGDVVTLSQDEPEEVQRVTSYKPVANTENEWVGNKETVEETLVLNPYPNEHACRVEDPSHFKKESFRRKQITEGVSIIVGKKESGGSMIVQAHRFSADKFTAAEAKKWLKDHDISCTEFEAASGKTNNELGNSIVDEYLATLTNNTSIGDFTMPLTAEQKTGIANDLVTNCSCHQQVANLPWKGKDAATLAQMPDEVLTTYALWQKSLVPPQQVSNNNPPSQFPPDWKNKFINADGSHRVFDPVTNEWVNMPLPQQIPVAQPVQNANPQAPTPTPSGHVQNSKETPEQYLARTMKDAPPAVAAMWTQLQTNYATERENLLNTITANAEGEAKDALRKLYEGMDNNALKMIVQTMPQGQQQDTHNTSQGTNYSLALPSYQPPINEKPLPLPVYDFTKK